MSYYLLEMGLLERKISKKIDDWFEHSSSALLIDGARQVGKTTIIDESFKHKDVEFIKLDLLKNKLARKAFNTSQTAEQLMLKLSSFAKKKLDFKRTVFFIDEIQEADDAITPIKYLVEQRKARFVFSGSLLGVKMKDIDSLPVGYLQIERMHPLDFEEFCLGLGVSEGTISYLKKCFDNETLVDEVIHERMMSLFRVYLAVGGLPKAVFSFKKSNDLVRVNAALAEIDAGYRIDVAKYEKKDKLLIQDIYDLMPSELNNPNKRFILKDLNEKSRFYQREASFVWLRNSGVGLFVNNTSNPIYPLAESKDRKLFKLFPNDVGLLDYKLYSGNQIALLEEGGPLNCGASYEAFVAEELVSHSLPLFYSNDKKRGEIDFLIEIDNKVVPIEVKSGKDYKRHSALTRLLSDSCYGIENGYVLCNGNLKREGKALYIPIYMTMFLRPKPMPSSMKIKLDLTGIS